MTLEAGSWDRDSGTRVRAVHFAYSPIIDDNVSVPPGTLGTVADVDDAGTIHVRWDNGRHIGLAPGDRWELVTDGEETQKAKA